jgi:hypothetical protein
MKLPRYKQIFGILIYQCLRDFDKMKALIKASVKIKQLSVVFVNDL